MKYLQPNVNYTKQDWLTRQRIVWDIECYINYFLLVVYDYDTEQMLGYWLMFNDVKYGYDDPRTVFNYLQDKHIITFNGLKYDELILALFVRGGTNAQLKQLSDSIIVGQNGNKFHKITRYKFQNLYKIELFNYLHTDILEPSFGSASLKVYGARLKLKKLQELPIDPSATITEDQLPLLLHYCINDCYVTKKLYEYLVPALNLRISMGEYYKVGLDFLCKNDAQIGDHVVKVEVERLTNTKFTKPNLASHPMAFRYVAPPWIQFKTDYMQADVLELAEAIMFHINPKTKKVIPPEEFKQLVTLEGKSFQVAIGGLHSTDDQGSYFADDDYDLFNFDIGSFYPWIIQNGEFHPRNIPFHIWQKLYQELVDKRMDAKRRIKSGQEVDPDLIKDLHRIIASVKIILNGIYGKLSEQYSNVADPSMLAHVTVTGQLAMLMMIENLYLLNVQVVSANTDGITVLCRKSLSKDVENMVTEWCADTGFSMDYEHYESIHYLNVNSYFYKDTNGHMHGIGDFADDGIRKSQDCSIIRDACFELIDKGTPIEDTIFASRDIDSFVTLTTIQGGAIQFNDAGVFEDVGKTIRFYRSMSSDHPIQRKKPNNKGTHNKVPLSDNAVVVNDYPDEFPQTDIRYQFYIYETYKSLLRLGLIDDTGEYYYNSIDGCVGFIFPNNADFCKTSVDKGYLDMITFSQFLVGIKVDKPFLRKNDLKQFTNLIPVKPRKKKVKKGETV